MADTTLVTLLARVASIAGVLTIKMFLQCREVVDNLHHCVDLSTAFCLQRDSNGLQRVLRTL